MADLAYVLLALAGFAALLVLVGVLDSAGPVAAPGETGRTAATADRMPADGEDQR